jgi:hypothetical protein
MEFSTSTRRRWVLQHCVASVAGREEGDHLTCKRYVDDFWRSVETNRWSRWLPSLKWRGLMAPETSGCDRRE